MVFATITKSYSKKTLDKMANVKDMKKYLDTYFNRITIPAIYTIFYDAYKQQTIIYTDAGIHALLQKNKKIVPPKAEIKTDEESDEEPKPYVIVQKPFNAAEYVLNRSTQYRVNNNPYEEQGAFNIDSHEPYNILS